MNRQKGPIVIGGVGGSGTRVLAQILLELNYYLGKDLNQPLDNISYTLLFKRKKWYIKNRFQKHKIARGIRIFEKLMTGKEKYNLYEYIFLLKATIDIFTHGHNHLKDGKGVWAIDRLKNMILDRSIPLNAEGWGWKEPNVHLIFEDLVEYYPTLKYIHLVRNGLDMAYSPNQQQFHNWASLYGISSEIYLPELSFEYWMRSNQKLIDIGENNYPNNFLLLNFDDLCSDPKNEIEKMLTFLEIDCNEERFERILSIPKVPLSSGRYKSEDISWLRQDHVDFLRKMNF